MQQLSATRTVGDRWYQSMRFPLECTASTILWRRVHDSLENHQFVGSKEIVVSTNIGIFRCSSLDLICHT